MDTLDRLAKMAGRLDERIIGLFEKRMSLTREAAGYKKKHGIRADKKKADIGGIVTDTACDIEVIEYTEGLIMYIHAVSKKLESKILKKK
ncbi:MAG: chorismate mutase [Eubacteriales bacterium]|nr:chorismate mutase [Eubacteriales bacterium]